MIMNMIYNIVSCCNISKKYCTFAFVWLNATSKESLVQKQS